MKLRSTWVSLLALSTVAALSACSGSSLGGESGGGAADDDVRIGVLIGLSGVYAASGEDMQAGLDLYLDQHDGKLGGREVELVVVDEGADAQSGVAGATRLVQQENVDAVVGITTGPTAIGSRDIIDAAGVPVLMVNSGSVPLGTDLRSDWVWRTGYDNGDPGRLLGAAMAADESAGDFYIIAADYSGGHEHLDGFKQAFPADRIVGETYTPFGTTSDFSPYIAQIRASGADKVFAFFAGAEAINFVKQYSQLGMSETTPLYGAGFLTEGSVLAAEGEAALGVYNVKRYNWDIENPENEKFVADYEAANGDVPNTYSASMYDTAKILDEAIGNIEGDVTHDAIREAIDDLGGVDGVRGKLSFDDANTVVQPFYLTQVQETPEGLRDIRLETFEPATR